MLDALLTEVSMAVFVAGAILLPVYWFIRSEEECSRAGIPRWQRPSAFWLGIALIVALSL